MMRITKGKHQKITVYTKGDIISWECSRELDNCPSHKARMQGQMIKDCVELDFGIYLGSDSKKVLETMHIRSLQDGAGKHCVVEIAYLPGCVTHISLKKDNEFFRNFTTFENAMKYVQEKFYVVKSDRMFSADGCRIEKFNCITL